MPSREHVVITGTGRCGTTFLVELLTHLGLETGFSDDDIAIKKIKEARAGLEHDVRQKDCPFIVKSPHFCNHAEEVLQRDDINIEHVFIPIRNLNAAAESRRHVAKVNIKNLHFLGRLRHMIKPRKFPGGLWYTSSEKPGKQEEILMEKLYGLMLAISSATFPVTVMRYPRIINDCPYLYEKLKPVLKDITYETFNAAFNETVHPELAHRFNKDDR